MMGEYLYNRFATVKILPQTKEIAVMCQNKAALDPRGNLNPGRIFDPIERL